MTTTGLLRHIDDAEHDRHGGVLALSGLSDDDRVSLRAWIGPREARPECGAVIAYTNGHPLAKLDTTSLNEGRLSLRVLDENGAVKETVRLDAGVGGDRNGGLRLERADHLDEWIELGFDDQSGPFVEVVQGQHFSRMTLYGISSASKENNFVTEHPRDPTLAIHYCVL